MGRFEVHELYGVGVMEKIRRGWWGFFSYTRFEVGDGSKIKFWHNTSCKDQALEEAIIDLYSIACANDAFVQENLELSGESYKWNVSFIRAAQDWVVDAFVSFFNLLNPLRLSQRREDKLRWAPSKRGMFTERSFYSVLVPHDNTHFSWKHIWQSKAPLRVTFFAWTATLRKIIIVDNLLRKRHIIVVDWCYMCQNSGESVDHLLLHWIVSVLWNAILSCVGLAWILPKRAVDLLACWKKGCAAVLKVQ